MPVGTGFARRRLPTVLARRLGGRRSSPPGGRARRRVRLSAGFRSAPAGPGDAYRPSSPAGWAVDGRRHPADGPGPGTG
ncbi:hypothetical protein LV779_01860 [Streptomyces thinghirensis]|nr:hypothetical protein [Streptomyces thinghirensis]